MLVVKPTIYDTILARAHARIFISSIVSRKAYARRSPTLRFRKCFLRKRSRTFRTRLGSKKEYFKVRDANTCGPFDSSWK